MIRLRSSRETRLPAPKPASTLVARRSAMISPVCNALPVSEYANRLSATMSR